MSPARFRCATQLGYRTVVAGLMLLDGVLEQFVDYEATMTKSWPQQAGFGLQSLQL